MSDNEDLPQDDYETDTDSDEEERELELQQEEDEWFIAHFDELFEAYSQGEDSRNAFRLTCNRIFGK